MDRVSREPLDAAAAGFVAGSLLAAALFIVGPPVRWVGYDPARPPVTEVEYYLQLAGLVAAGLASWWLMRRSAWLRFGLTGLWTAFVELVAVVAAAKVYWMIFG